MQKIAIVGAGAAGLSMAYYLATRPDSPDFGCILIDPDDKRENDRTWAFWGDDFDFDDLVSHRWPRVSIHYQGNTTEAESADYRYIRGDRFYTRVFRTINNDRRFEFVRGRVEEITETEEGATVTYRRRSAGGYAPRDYLTVDYVVDSVFGPADAAAENHLRQTFVGWEVELSGERWDPDLAKMMEFVDGPHPWALEFYYTLPLSPRRALLEYTAVDTAVPEPEYLEEQLHAYMEAFASDLQWTVHRREKGTIPLYERRQPTVQGRVIRLGVAAGAARPSTGYAFRTIVESSRALAEAFAWNGDFRDAKVPTPHRRRRPRFYDDIFLELLRGEPDRMPGALYSLFRGSSGERVFRFLQGSSSLLDEVYIIVALPWAPFLAALGRRISKPLTRIIRQKLRIDSRSQGSPKRERQYDF